MNRSSARSGRIASQKLKSEGHLGSGEGSLLCLWPYQSPLMIASNLAGLCHEAGVWSTPACKRQNDTWVASSGSEMRSTTTGIKPDQPLQG